MANTKTQSEIENFTETTHKFVMFYPVLFFLASIYYAVFSNHHFFWVPILALLFIVVNSYFMFYGKKIVVTNKKVYVFVNRKKIISWSLIEELSYIDYQQDRIGKFLNYGTLVLVNQNKDFYSYSYLNNGKNIFHHLMINYEKEMLKLDPNYEMRYTKSVNNVDKLDSIET